jgi:echinoid protein
MAAWRIVETVPIHGTVNAPTYKRVVIEHLNTIRRTATGRSLNDDEELTMALEDENSTKVRVKLCLKVNHERCGEYADAEREYRFIYSSNKICPVISLCVSDSNFLLLF